MQSRIHEIWARTFSGTSMDLLNYAPSDCFETYPFPLTWASDDGLAAAGKAYNEYRASLMLSTNQGLTSTYNRFHNPDERSVDIDKLRQLHTAMDRAVLLAYGWRDLAEIATCQFLLDYEDDDDEEDLLAGTSPSRRQKKKPWRYRWPDEFRDEVLARLLELNKQRAEQERLTGEVAAAKQTGTTKATRSKSKKSKTKAGESATLLDSLDAGGD